MDLVLSLSLKRAISHSDFMNTLKVFGERLQRLTAELVPAANEFGAVALVVAHIEPFHLQRGIRHWNVAGWELFGDAQHLLKAMEMIHRHHHEFLMEHMVAAGCQVDVLAIPRRAFVERFDHKKINCSIKILSLIHI